LGDIINKIQYKTFESDLPKGIVHPQMKICPWFIHPEVIPGVYDILLSENTIRVILKNVLALPSLMMGVNG